MNNKTMLYGLLVAGGLLAYFAWKKHNADTSKTSENASTVPASTASGTFVDDVPVSPKVLGLNTNPTTLVDSVKNTVSHIVEPFIGTKEQTQLSGQGQFIES